MIQLAILLPGSLFFDGEVGKITAEAPDGSFCLLPRHVDTTFALAPGLLYYETAAGEECFAAVDEGILVKRGQRVHVSVRDAAHGPNLEMLQRTVQERFRSLNDQEARARSALARLEADFVRRFIELEGHGYD